MYIILKELQSLVCLCLCGEPWFCPPTVPCRWFFFSAQCEITAKYLCVIIYNIQQCFWWIITFSQTTDFSTSCTTKAFSCYAAQSSHNIEHWQKSSQLFVLIFFFQIKKLSFPTQTVKQRKSRCKLNAVTVKSLCTDTSVTLYWSQCGNVPLASGLPTWRSECSTRSRKAFSRAGRDSLSH